MDGSRGVGVGWGEGVRPTWKSSSVVSLEILVRTPREAFEPSVKYVEDKQNGSMNYFVHLK